MKICILTERMKIGFGVDLVVDEQAIRLTRLGHQVVVVVIYADLDQPARDYELVVLGKLGIPTDFGTPQGMRRVLDGARITDVDVWVLHTPSFYDWAQWLDGPTVMVEHGTPPGHFFPADVGRHLDLISKNRLEGLYTRLQPFDRIVSISRSIHEWLPPSVRSSSSTIIYNGCDHFPKAGPERGAELRRSLGIHPSTRMVVWVGRMQLGADEQPYKGFQELLSLIPEARSRLPHAHFLLVGRVSKEDQLKLEATGLSILPNASVDEMASAYAAADVFLNLSRWEGFNLALLEAQSEGTPAVAYDIGPHPEVVDHGKTGFLARNSDDLLSSLTKLVSDDNLRKRFAKAAVPFAGRFTWAKNVDEFDRLIVSLMSRAPPKPEIAKLRHAALAAEALVKRPAPRQSKLARHLDLMSRDVRGLSEALGAELGRRGIGKTSHWFTSPNDVFIREAYLAILGREAEPAAIDAITRQLRHGRSRESVLNEIRQSEEGRHRSIENASVRGILGTRAARRLRSERQWKPSDVPTQLLMQVEEAQHVLAGEVGRLASQVDRLAAALSALQPDLSVRPEPEQTRSASPDRLPSPTYIDRFAIGEDYAMLVAPGAIVTPAGFEALMNAALATASDIVFGDDMVCVPDGVQATIGRHGPFSEELFALKTELGGVLAVRREILERLALPSAAVLTSSLLAQIVAAAFTISYVPTILCKRLPDDATIWRSAADHHVSDHSINHAFGTSAPAVVTNRGKWKAAVVVMPAPSRCEGHASKSPVGLPADDRLTLIEVSEFCHEPNFRTGVTREKIEAPRGATFHTYGQAVNYAVRGAPDECDLVVLIERGLTPISGNWLERLAEISLRPQTGVVAPKTLYDGGRLRHAGLMLGGGKLCSYIARFDQLQAGSGDADRLSILREVSAVSRHCMVMRREVFVDSGGFDDKLGVDAADVDFCLRLRSIGLSIFLDGLTCMRSADDWPRWSRSPQPSDVLTLLQRHSQSLLAPDKFWVTASAEGSALRTTIRQAFLPKPRAGASVPT